MTGPIILAALSVSMFVFGRWGQLRAAKLAVHERTSEQRLRKQRSIRTGAVAWQCVAAIVLIFTMIELIHAL